MCCKHIIFAKISLIAEEKRMDSDNLPDLDNTISPKEQFKIIKQTAKCGNVQAMLKLSEFYKTGFGTTVDLEKSEYWYKRAIN